MKAPFLVSMYLGDTELDVHGHDNIAEEIYISGTNHEISELIHVLNWDLFKAAYREAIYNSRTF